MKLIHFSDTHLGFSDLTRIEPETGINQREADFYAAWWRVIDVIIQEKPDFVVHAGDLFQTPRPNNRAIRIALEGVQKLGDAGIPLVVVAGNHSTPRIRQTGSIFESLALFSHVHAAFENRYARFRIGDCAIHCIPHCSLSEELEAAYAAIVPDKTARFQILVTHGAWRESGGEYVGSIGEFNEQFIDNPEQRLDFRFDYIALGHYHKYLKVAENAIYSGSTERTSFNEIGYTSGYVRVDLERHQDEYVEIPFRPMLKIGPVDCQGLRLEEIYAAIKTRSAAPAGGLLRLELVNLARETLLGIDLQEIDKCFPEALYVEKIFRPAENNDLLSTTASIGSLQVEFARYVEEQEDLAFDREKFVQMGLALLHEAEDEETLA